MITNKNIWQRIAKKKKQLDSLRPLSPVLVNRLKEQVIIEWTYNSNAIEGTRLSLKETQLVLEQGLTIKGIPLKDHFEALNHKEAILFLEKLITKKRLSVNALVIRQIHQLILKNIDQDNAGRYRQVEVEITGSKYKPPHPVQIPAQMSQLSQWLKNNKNKQNIVDYAALAHLKLVSIHPFIDGNGRTARLLMNLILIEKGFPPTIILKTERKQYYSALEKAHTKNFEPFASFIASNVERSLTLYLEAVRPAKDKAKEDKWQLLSQLSPKTPYSQEYLSLLARRRKIEAVKKGRNWYSNLSSIEEYRKSIGK